MRLHALGTVTTIATGMLVGVLMGCGDVHDTGVHVTTPTTMRSAAAGPVDSAAQRPAAARPDGRVATIWIRQKRRWDRAVFIAAAREVGAGDAGSTPGPQRPATSSSPVSTLPGEQPVVIIGAPAAQSYDWDAIAACETGGNWSMHGSTYSSALGIMNQAVRENASPDVAGRVLAGIATRAEQIAIGERMAARFGIHAWACGRKLYP